MQLYNWQKYGRSPLECPCEPLFHPSSQRSQVQEDIHTLFLVPCKLSGEQLHVSLLSTFLCKFCKGIDDALFASSSS
eukprot:1502358-Amphidinium_carterae.1